MKDHRLQIFRNAVEGLVESLEAVIRLSRWTGQEAKPEPLVAAASQLISRLGTADRLAASRFSGPAADVTRVTAMCAAMRRLDAAHLVYRKRMDEVRGNAEGANDAAAALEVEVAATTAGAAAWR
ncbi:hypothetical protein BH09MYX1_BH09MYX1_58340 [soil metagenome]